jgi:hypothetical protein
MPGKIADRGEVGLVERHARRKIASSVSLRPTTISIVETTSACRASAGLGAAGAAASGPATLALVFSIGAGAAESAAG